jgi:hypothetical protein
VPVQQLSTDAIAKEALTYELLGRICARWRLVGTTKVDICRTGCMTLDMVRPEIDTHGLTPVALTIRTRIPTGA